MHHRLLITLAMPDGATSLDARISVHHKLLEDESFCGTGGRFGSPLCDWFVLGGRWSGMLKEQLLGQEYRDTFAREFPEFAKGWYATNLVERHEAGLDQLWQRFGGQGKHPITRSGYEEFGEDDDAMPIDAALHERFLKEYHGLETSPDFHFADLDGEPVDEWFIGCKWLVVVDYHN
jgi:hypothetical protein